MYDNAGRVEEDDEESVKNAIKESFGKKIPTIRANDFEFVKLHQKKISRVELDPDKVVITVLCGEENGWARTAVRESERRIRVSL